MANPAPATLSPRRRAAPASLIATLTALVAACSGSTDANGSTAAQKTAPTNTTAPDTTTLRPLDLAAMRTAAPVAAPGRDRTPAPSALELKPLRDRAGRVSAYLPLPTDWQLDPKPGGNYTLSAPGGVRVGETETSTYAWAADPFAREGLARTGAQLAPPMSAERVLAEAIVPMARAQGYEHVATYPLPAVQAFWQAFGDAMPQTGTRRAFTVLASDWRGADGARSCVVLLHMRRDGGGVTSWEVRTTELEAPEGSFDGAKRTWHEGLAHVQMDEAWQRAQGMQLTGAIRDNLEESRRWMALGARQHERRMADIAAAGRAARDAGRTSSEILDIGHRGYLDRSAANDVGHARTTDAIGERAVVVDPASGRRYEVDAGYRYYWGDGDRGFVGTDDPNFDPRLDPSLRHLPWVRFDPTRR